MSEPSNSEIMEKLGYIEAKFEGKLVDILTQVKRTNGRVTKLEGSVTFLEKWKDKLDTIADYTKQNGKGEPVIDWQKMLMYALGLVGTALAVIAAMASR